MLLRTLSLLRSLQGAHHTTQDARARIQQACDYRWLASQLPHGVIVPRATRLDDGTPAVPVMVPFVATPERRRGGRWPADPEARERCYVEGGHACRAAGAPGYRTLESLSQGLVQGGMAVLKDAARFQYLEEREALRLTWRRLASLPADLAGGLGGRLATPDSERHGLFLLELRLPAAPSDIRLEGDWLDRCLDRYRRILPAPAD
ncbi:hypothetical protein FIU83_04660 [Halomonas sp. THAF5a]|uniref:hypothetical protein n=1 Tax=Halomonas sp. THAF5a TaxID=2587844 RepID=UPI001267EA90|nr:hypothetical protein [Halomonas sp. THAF5a]QFU00926.1 hypothetical protein FIU83_04660 [Halomonas sp. THAF5a]